MSCLDRTRAGELFELYEEDVIRKELYPIFVKLARHVPRISRCRAGDPVADNLVRDERYGTREAIHHARRAGDPVADNLAALVRCSPSQRVTLIPPPPFPQPSALRDPVAEVRSCTAAQLQRVLQRLDALKVFESVRVCPSRSESVLVCKSGRRMGPQM